MPSTRPASVYSTATAKTASTSHTALNSPTSTTFSPPPVPTSSSARTVPQPPSTLTDGGPLPKLIVFDLDYTLWPFWVDTHVTPPLKAQEGGGKVKDRYGEGFGFYDDVPGVLAGLRQQKILIAAASRTQAPDLAREMLKLLKIQTHPTPSSSSSTTSLSRRASQHSLHSSSILKSLDLFDHLQIYPGSKIRHFEKLQKDTGLGYEEMLFFDDEVRNREVERLGVVMWLVRDGVSREEFDKGVESWRKRNRRVK